MDGRERAAAAMLLVENSCMGTRPAGGGDGRAGKRERAAAAMLGENSCSGGRERERAVDTVMRLLVENTLLRLLVELLVRSR